MPSSMSPALATSLSSTATKLAVLAKLVRTDGVAVGVTSWDEPITHDGLTYLPDEIVKMSVITASLGADVDNGSASGARTSRISENIVDDDIYDNAVLDIYLMNLMTPEAGVRVLFSGTIGDISIVDEEWSVSFRAWSAKLKNPSGELSSKKCTCQRLGDKRCKVNLATATVNRHTGARAATATRTVTAVVGPRKFKVGSESAPNDFYTFGFARFTSGANAGKEFEIKEHKLESGSVGVLELRLLALPVAPGDTLVIEAGCNRKLRYESPSEAKLGSTCSEFLNEINFRGQHWLPGNNQVTRVATTQ